MPSDHRALFLFVTGAGSLVVVADLIRGLHGVGFDVYSVVTPNVAQVTDVAALMTVPGNRWISDYGQPPLDRYPFGTLLVAPCTFNTLNKLAAGIADNLATAMIGDAIGAGNRVVIAPGMNRGQWSHPRVAQSLETLTQWGCEVVPPRVGPERVQLASRHDILATVGEPPGLNVERPQDPRVQP